VSQELSIEAKYAAALAEEIYRRAGEDQSLVVGGIGLPGEDFPLKQAPLGLTPDTGGPGDIKGTYYYNKLGSESINWGQS
jgi:hypothetical protein